MKPLSKYSFYLTCLDVTEVQPRYAMAYTGFKLHFLHFAFLPPVQRLTSVDIQIDISTQVNWRQMLDFFDKVTNLHWYFKKQNIADIK